VTHRAGGRRRSRPVVAAILAVVWAMLAVGSVLGASPTPTAPPPGPPYPEPVEDQAVYDFAGVFRPETITQAENIVDAIESQTGVEVVVYTQAMGRDDLTTDETADDAAALMDEWGVGRAGIDDGLVILFELDTSNEHGQIQLYAGDGFESRYLSTDERQAIFDNEMVPQLRNGDFDGAVLIALGRVLEATFAPPADPGQPAPAEPSPGPPFPEPVTDRAVYDYAGILTPDAIVRAEAVIDGIEARTGAEVVVYTQLTGYYGIDTAETESRARALIDQWQIGRAGFNDGMVIFFDIDPSLEHGQVQLYAAPGFEAAFLSNAERQSIFENDMVPLLRNADFDGALEVALRKVDAAATPEHAASLEQARQLNAVLGLIGAPVVLLGLSGWAFFNWRRFGKDPVYLDDPSILMPAPPPDLTAASGAMVMDGGTSRRALTTAMLDLASRGLLTFREEKGLLGLNKKVGVDVDPGTGDDTEEAQRARNARRPIGPAEEVALRKLQSLGLVGGDGYISPEELPKFGSSVGEFDRALEQHVVERGWFAEAPSKVSARWTGKAILIVIAGVIALVAGWNIPISGLVLIGVGTIAGGIIVLLFAQAMPAVTMPGAIIRAMLAAYRRTLEKTMAQARTMQQVVDQAGLDWLETPDQAVVWGTALGLQHEIEGVLDRSLEEAKAATAGASPIWFPTWYRSSDGSSFASAGAAAGSGGSLFSDSGMPDLGGMMSALGTIGNSPSSSGSGGSGGGFSGGSSGGGGGGAGGGF
jgi:uncharacterized membrane protein YgcG